MGEEQAGKIGGQRERSPTRPTASIPCFLSQFELRDDDGELVTLAIQLGRGDPLLVEDAMDEHCWSIAKAMARHTMTVQFVLEHVATLHLIGSKCRQRALFALVFRLSP